jgi:hypothetical protein
MTVKQAKENRLRFYKRYVELKKEWGKSFSIPRAAERLGITKTYLARQVHLVKKYGEERDALGLDEQRAS